MSEEIDDWGDRDFGSEHVQHEFDKLQAKYRIAWEALHKISSEFGRQSPEMRVARKALKDISYVGIEEGKAT